MKSRLNKGGCLKNKYKCVLAKDANNSQRPQKANYEACIFVNLCVSA